MRIFNRVLSTILSLFLIAGTLTGIIYLIGVATGSSSITRPISGSFGFVTGLSSGQVASILIVMFIISIVLFVLEVKPTRPKLITISESDRGTTKVHKSGIELYLADHLAMERRTITPRRMDVVLLDDYRFKVETDVAVSTTANRDEVRDQVSNTIRNDLAAIGLDKELARVRSQVERVKRAA